jgi:signal transduction histidine kinase/DNA-binding response OmpR family regulator
MRQRAVISTLRARWNDMVARLANLPPLRAQIEAHNRTLKQRLEECTQELTEALQQQTATREILHIIRSSPTDVQPTFDAIAASATALCEAMNGGVFRFDGTLIDLVAHHNWSPEELAVVQRVFPIPPGRGSVTARAILTGTVAHVPDLATDPEYMYSSLVQAGFHTVLSVPMLRDGAPLGALTVTRSEVKPFSEKQIALLKTFADQAVIAIENVRLFQELQTRTSDLARSVQEMTVLSQVSQAVSATLDLQEVLTTIVTQAVQLTQTDGGTIYEFDATEQVFVPRASYGVSREFVDVLRQLWLRIGDESIVGRASARRTPLQLADLLNEPDYPLLFVQQAGFRAVLAVPLLREDRPIGALVVLRRAAGTFPKETVDLLQTFATQSTLAIQNARLFQEIDDKSRQLGIANQRLQELDQLKSDFLSTVSHELRTPLTSVLGFARIIARRYEESLLPHLDQSQARVRRDAQRISENVQIIIDEGERLTRLINEVLDLAKIESGKMEWQMQEVSLHEVVQRAVNATSSLARDKGLDVRVVSHSQAGQVYGDADRLTQVVTNLLGNAIKFTNQGSVTCVLERHANDITVKVQDTGVGIAPKDLDKVFEKFRQVGDTLTDKPTGTGLGLPICKEIIEHHGGRIWVESTPGLGSTFIFTLPALPERLAPAPEIPLLSQVKQRVAATLPQGTADTRRILIVDDEKHLRTLLRQELEGADYHVLEAQDGHTALQLAKTAHPHLIILDILMPGLDGFQVTTLLKQDATTASIPILILSIVEDKERGYRLGVDSYLTKPVDSAQLLATVASLVARGPTRPSTRKKILVIEDDASMVRAIEQALSAYEVTAVQDSSEGVRLAQQERPDVIILDASLPEAGELVKTLRSLTETRESQLLMLAEPLKAEIATILGTLRADESAPAHKAAG